MSEPNHNDEYRSHFEPKEYLRQYYSLPRLAADDAELFRTLCGWLRRTGRTFSTAIDVGCGPTIHNSFALAPYAERIELADYLLENRAEVRSWLDGSPDAHDWDPLFRGVLEFEGTPADQLEDRKRLYRERVVGLRSCDLSQPLPLGEPLRFDLVTSFFCAECVSTDRETWERYLGRICDLVNPGGALFLAAMRGTTRYRSLGHWFPATPVTEDDAREVLIRHGFPSERIEAHAAHAPDWKDDGFDQIFLVAATKP